MTYLTKAKLIEAMKDLPDDTPILFEYRGPDSNNDVLASGINVHENYEKGWCSCAEELPPNFPKHFTAVVVGYSSDYNL